MEKLVLVVNPGSTSDKYSLWRDAQKLHHFHYETLPGQNYRRTYTDKNSQSYEQEIDALTFIHSIDDLLRHSRINIKDIEAVAIRIVAPGSYFAQHRAIDEQFLKKLKSAKQMAPLHIERTRELITRIHRSLPDIPMYAISDSAFHASMLPAAKHYGIDPQIAKNLDIYRFGYHGLSVAASLKQLHAMSGDYLHKKVIVCHLGGGSSITAVRDDRSVDTSMGFSPLEGLPMVTRSGTMDIVAAMYLAKRKYLTDEQLVDYLFKHAGLSAMNQGLSDVREIIDRAKAGNSLASASLEHFSYQIRSHIGSYIAHLGGLDALIFTGTIGCRSSFIRALVCTNLEHLGLHLDTQKNESPSQEYFINSDGSIAIAVIDSDEESEIYNELRLLDKPLD